MEEAFVAHDKALALDSSSAYAYNQCGVTLRRLGRLEEALAAYDRALALDPKSGSTYDNRGIALRHLGRLEEAVADFDKAVALDPRQRSAALVNKGIVLAEMGSLDEALAELDAAASLAPSGGGEGAAWAAAILWHRQDAVRSMDRFASVEGQVTDCSPFHTAELEAVALCALGQADNAEKRLLDALTLRCPGDWLELRTVYELLSDPPLPGIDRLRVIVDNDT